MCFVVAAQVMFTRHWKNFRPTENSCIWMFLLHGTTLTVRKFLAGTVENLAALYEHRPGARTPSRAREKQSYGCERDDRGSCA